MRSLLKFAFLERTTYFCRRPVGSSLRSRCTTRRLGRARNCGDVSFAFELGHNLQVFVRASPQKRTVSFLCIRLSATVVLGFFFDQSRFTQTTLARIQLRFRLLRLYLAYLTTEPGVSHPTSTALHSCSSGWVRTVASEKTNGRCGLRVGACIYTSTIFPTLGFSRAHRDVDKRSRTLRYTRS